MCARVYICDQSYCLAEWFKIPTDQRTHSPIYSLSSSPKILCAVIEAFGKLIQLYLVHDIPVREEQECFRAAGKCVSSIRDLYLMKLFFLAVAPLLIFLS